MGLMDKAKRAVQGRSEQIERGVDKAAKAVDKRTGGKYRDKLDKGAEQVKSRARSMDEQRRMERDGVVEPGGTTGTGPVTGTGPATGTGPTTGTEPRPDSPHDQPGSPGL